MQRTVILALLLTVLSATGPVATGSPFGPPDGFDQFLVFLGGGLYDPTEPHPVVPGCFQLFCEGPYFQEVVMGRTPAEILEQEALAKAFFLQRFGIDVDDPANEGRLVFLFYTADPRVDYRVYHMAGEKVPSTGWEILDGGFLWLITDPDGYELGGEFAGVHVPAGAFASFGEYAIQKTLLNGAPDGQIVLRFKAKTPILPKADGSLLALCELEHPEWGSGLAQVLMANVQQPGGLLKINLRNVSTFPSLSD
ncbi:MAG: hypothetical protein AAF657_23505 [Acidobacteriota bacterium]